jgi:endo-1,4-beta-xylanase
MMRNFNVAVLNGFSWKGIWLGPDQYDFEWLDVQVNNASQPGRRVRASHLVWGATEAQIPDWLLHGQFTRDQYIELLEKYIKAVVNRYKGRVQEWSIANEYASRSFYGAGDFWNEKIGPEYVEMAF